MTTHHNSNIHNAITLIRFTPNVTPCNVTTSWEEYRQHWLHTGVAAVWGGRGQGTRAQHRVEKWRETRHIRVLTTPDTRRSHAVTRRSNNEQ